MQALLKKGLSGPYQWYKIQLVGSNSTDEACEPIFAFDEMDGHFIANPQEAFQIDIPTFFDGAFKDRICPSFQQSRNR